MKTTDFMIIFWLALAAFIILPGCAGPTVSYHKYGASAEQQNQDFAECRFEAIKATASAPGGSIAYAYQASNTIANDIAIGMRQGEIMSTCLAARGYYAKRN